MYLSGGAGKVSTKLIAHLEAFHVSAGEVSTKLYAYLEAFLGDAGEVSTKLLQVRVRILLCFLPI